jgi:hypothetical protein
MHTTITAKLHKISASDCQKYAAHDTHKYISFSWGGSRIFVRISHYPDNRGTGNGHIEEFCTRITDTVERKKLRKRFIKHVRVDVDMLSAMFASPKQSSMRSWDCYSFRKKGKWRPL